MHIANEGKLVCICPADRAQDVLDVMRSHPEESRDAALIRTVGDRAARNPRTFAHDHPDPEELAWSTGSRVSLCRASARDQSMTGTASLPTILIVDDEIPQP
jgi:hypothetical protein